MFAGRLVHGGGVVEISEAALAGPPPPERPQPSDLLLQGLAVRFTEGYAAGAPLLKEALNAFQREADLSPNDARWLWFASLIALYMWDDDAWTVAFHTTARARARRRVRSPRWRLLSVPAPRSTRSLAS